MLKDGVHCVSGVRHELFVSQKICIDWPNTKEEKIKKIGNSMRGSKFLYCLLIWFAESMNYEIKG